MIIAAGELLVEFVSHQKDCGLQEVTTFSGPYPSGAPAICIDQAARVGARTIIFGSVGADAFGQSLVDRLARDGVDVSGIARLTGLATGAAFVSYYSDGHRVFVFHIDGTAANRVTLGALPTEPFILHVSGASLGMEMVRDATLALCKHARSNGGRICCDPNVRTELLGNPVVLQTLTDIIAQSEIVLPSEADLAFLYPDLDRNAACDALLDGGAKMVVVKMGSAGVELVTRAGRTHMPAHPVDEVDPTGAGDCFCGTFLGLLDQGHDPLTACRYANAAGAMHVTTRGPMEWNPTLSEIEHFLDQGAQNAD